MQKHGKHLVADDIHLDLICLKFIHTIPKSCLRGLPSNRDPHTDVAWTPAGRGAATSSSEPLLDSNGTFALTISSLISISGFVGTLLPPLLFLLLLHSRAEQILDLAHATQVEP